jgi:ribosomal protein L11
MKISSIIKTKIKNNNNELPDILTPILGSKGINVKNLAEELINDIIYFEEDLIIPLIIIIYENKKYKTFIKTPYVSYCIQQIIKTKGNSTPKHKIYEIISREEIFEIISYKVINIMKNTFNLKKTFKIFLSTVNSMGLTILS